MMRVDLRHVFTPFYHQTYYVLQLDARVVTGWCFAVQITVFYITLTTSTHDQWCSGVSVSVQ